MGFEEWAHRVFVLGDDDEATYPPQAPPLNTICYMWWDNFPSWGHPDEPATLPIDEALIGLMREQLDSRNLAVVESGLHGLGHWQFHYPGEVAAIVDGYLNRHPSADLVIRQYATWARNGHVM